MKRSILMMCLAGLTGGISANAGIISDNVKLIDGRIVDFNHIYTVDDSPTFRTVDEESANWELSIETPEGWKTILTELQSGSITIDDFFSIFPQEKMRVYEEGDSGYFKLKINADSQSESDSRILYYNCIPSRPIISNVEIHGNYNWEYDDYDLGSYMTFRLYSERAEILHVLLESKNCHLTKPSNYFIDIVNIGYIKDPIVGTGGITIVPHSNSSNWYDVTVKSQIQWGQMFSLMTLNKYGESPSIDDMFTTDYITDPAVLARIDEMYRQAGVDSPNTSAPQMVIGNGNISFNDPENLIQEVSIYSISGMLLYQQSGNRDISTSDFPAGAYIINYKTKRGDSISNKYILR